MQQQSSERTEAGPGALLRRYRVEAGLTQEALAELVGYSTVYVSMLERGRRIPHAATLQHFAEALHLPPYRLRALVHAAGIDPTGSESLLGRATELDAIERLLEGHGPTLMALAGEPGIGKSALLRETAERAAAYGWRVLVSGCARRGTDDPLAPLSTALASVLNPAAPEDPVLDPADRLWLSRGLPEYGAGSGAPNASVNRPAAHERRSITSAVRRLLATIGGPRGTLLVLDDLQWATSDALDMLSDLLAADAPVPLHAVVAYRDTESSAGDPLSAMLANLVRRHDVSHLPLAPLGAEEAARLVARHAGSPPTGYDLLRWTGGIPFFLVSLGHALGAGRVPGKDIPWDLRQAIFDRVATLSESAQSLLPVAAVAGRSVSREVLAAGIGKPLDCVSEVLDELIATRLLVETGESEYRFSHDVIRDVIESNLTSARRARLHRLIAEALEGSPDGTAPTLLAYHYSRGDRGEKAIQALERAALHATRQHAYRTAVEYDQELLDRLEALARYREAAIVRERLAVSLATVGEYERALATLERAARMYASTQDRAAIGRTLAAIGRIHYTRGTPEEAIDRLASFAGVLTEEDHPQALATLLCALAGLYLSRGRYAEQADAAARAEILAQQVADDALLAEAKVWRGCALGQLGERAEGRRLQEAAIPFAEATNHLPALMHALKDVAFAHEQDGKFRRSRGYKDRALSLAEEIGDPAEIANMRFRCGQTAFLMGALGEAETLFTRAHAVLERVGPSALSPYPYFGQALLALARGRADTARQHAEQGLHLAADREDMQAARALEALLGELDIREGAPEAAVRRLAPLAGEREGLGVHPLESTLAEAYCRLGDLDAGTAWADWSLNLAERQQNRVARVEALRVRALACREFDSALTAAREAADLARGMRYPVGLIRTLETLTSILEGAGEQQRLARVRGELAEARRLLLSEQAAVR